MTASPINCNSAAVIIIPVIDTISTTLDVLFRALNRVLNCFKNFAEKGFCMKGDMCPYDHGVDPVVVDDISLGDVLHFQGPGKHI